MGIRVSGIPKLCRRTVDMTTPAPFTPAAPMDRMIPKKTNCRMPPKVMGNPYKLEANTQHKPMNRAKPFMPQVFPGLVLQYIPLKNLTFQLIMQEPMRLIRKRFPGQNQRSVHPHELDPKGEVFLNWSVEYKLWHDTWFLGSQRPHLTVSTIALMTIALQDEENWGIVPESVARDIAVSCDLDILEIQEPPPERFIYFITNAAPAPESAGGIQMFWEGLIHYIKERGLYFQQMED